MEPLLLLAGMENGAATVENSVAVAQKVKLESSYDLGIIDPLLGVHQKN